MHWGNAHVLATLDTAATANFICTGMLREEDQDKLQPLEALVQLAQQGIYLSTRGQITLLISTAGIQDNTTFIVADQLEDPPILGERWVVDHKWILDYGKFKSNWVTNHGTSSNGKPPLNADPVQMNAPKLINNQIPEQQLQ
ncbi:hypothetical protein PR048_013826 [Dryococelus australis]|uniref:Uncharacterized protein n=1 Tax=Dryococelus australis TaxID=614101 RepID=A0ABQ9HTA5_9NEOP|nr:hypothetical protein PR048_013826 [Dryococelus australis]